MTPGFGVQGLFPASVYYGSTFQSVLSKHPSVLYNGSTLVAIMINPNRPSHSKAPTVSLDNRVKSTPTEADSPGSLPADSVVSAEVTDVPFNGFLKYKNYEVGVKLDDGYVQKLRGGFVHGPGHHIGAVAAFAFDEAMTPHPILKTGDTRLARAERAEPYVLDGFIAGRMDKSGADSSKIALAELAEEVGGEVVGQTFQKLGALTPTMPFESTEADNYYLAAVQITGKAAGDGGDMELTDLIGPKISSPLQTLEAVDEGEVSEAGRTRALLGRGFDAIGYVPQLGAYVHDHPQLAERFDTLGLGEVKDVRSMLTSSDMPKPQPPRDNLEAQVNDVVVTRRNDIELGSDKRMVDAGTKHAVNKNGVITELDTEFPNQYLQLDYDRAKLATYYTDPEAGPMILMTTEARPALAFAPESPKVIRRDVADIQISRDTDVSEQLPEGARMLGKGGGASAGQTDLYYHFMAKEVKTPKNPKAEGFVPIGEAIKMCRTGDGDAQTEALCEKLCTDLGWLPNLNMTVEQARSLMG